MTPILWFLVAFVLGLLVAIYFNARPRTVDAPPSNQIENFTTPPRMEREQPLPFSPSWVAVFSELHHYSLDDLFVRQQTTKRAAEEYHLTVITRPLDKLVDKLKRYQHVVCSNWESVALAQLAGCKTYFQGRNVFLRPEQIYAAAPWYFKHNHRATSTWTWNGAEFIVINLPRHTDRLALMSRRFKNNPERTWQRFPAVEGARWKNEYRDKIQWRSLSPFTGGRLGIYLSSLDIYAQLVQSHPEVQYCTVLEDDVNFARNMIPNPEHLVSLAPRDWDIIFLGVNQMGCFRALSDGPFIRLTSSCMPGAFAYIIRKKMARYLLKHAWPMTEPIDVVFQRLMTRFCMYSFTTDWAQADYTVVSSTAR